MSDEKSIEIVTQFLKDADFEEVQDVGESESLLYIDIIYIIDVCYRYIIKSYI